jgi:hypothetical protein
MYCSHRPIPAACLRVWWIAETRILSCTLQMRIHREGWCYERIITPVPASINQASYLVWHLHVQACDIVLWGCSNNPTIWVYMLIEKDIEILCEVFVLLFNIVVYLHVALMTIINTKLVKLRPTCTYQIVVLETHINIISDEKVRHIRTRKPINASLV